MGHGLRIAPNSTASTTNHFGHLGSASHKFNPATRGKCRCSEIEKSIPLERAVMTVGASITSGRKF